MADAWGEFDDETGRSARYGVAAPRRVGVRSSGPRRTLRWPAHGSRRRPRRRQDRDGDHGRGRDRGEAGGACSSARWRCRAPMSRGASRRATADGLRRRSIASGRASSRATRSRTCNASRAVADLPLVIDDHPTTADAFCALARAEHSRDPLSSWWWTTCTCSSATRSMRSRARIKVIRRQVYALKTLAKALRVPVLMLVQFTAAAPKSERPTMFDAFGGSGIEQGCDNVVIPSLMRPRRAQASAASWSTSTSAAGIVVRTACRSSSTVRARECATSTARRRRSSTRATPAAARSGMTCWTTATAPRAPGGDAE